MQQKLEDYGPSSETLLFCHMWLRWLLSVVLKCCCHGPATEEGSKLFLPLRVLRPDCGSKPSFRDGCRGGLPPRRGPGVGWTKGLTACLASGTLLISDFETRSHSHWVLSVAADLMLQEMWALSGYCVFMFARPYKVSGTWAFSWVTERSSGWHLFIPSSYAAWPLSKTSWTSWST